MENDQIYKIYQEYREDYPYRISELKNNLGKKWENNQVVHIGFPFVTRDGISGILNEFQRRGEDIKPYLKELEPFDREVEEFIQDHLNVYLEHVETQLTYMIKQFNPNNFLDAWDFENDIGIRSSFESYLQELEKNGRDIREYRKQINKLDEEFRKNIPVAVKEKTYLPNDEPWSPKEYWWLHLEEQYGYPDEIID